MLEIDFFVVLLWELEFANHLLMASTRILKLEQGCPWPKFGLHGFDMSWFVTKLGGQHKNQAFNDKIYSWLINLL
jgi:hypothetical protein